MFKFLLVDFYGVIFENSRVNTDFLDFLLRLRDRYEICLISNADRHVILVRYGNYLSDFSYLFFSSDFAFEKPHPEIFIQVLNKLGAKNFEVLFVDDSFINVDSARNLGITSILFDNTLQAEMEILEILGLLS